MLNSEAEPKSKLETDKDIFHVVSKWIIIHLYLLQQYKECGLCDINKRSEYTFFPIFFFE